MKNGEDLPNPLLVSRILTSDEYDSKIDVYISHNSLFVNWGQFLSHDLTFSSTFSTSNGFGARCCEGNKHPECIPLAMRFENNYVDSNYCFNFMRSVSSLRKKVDNPLVSQREQLNKLTAFIDASNVYGTTVEELRFLRDLNGHRAMLKSERTTYEIPIRSETSCRTSVPNCENKCLLLGEQRASVTSGLMGIHTLWLREHNRLVKKLQDKFSNKEILFQEVRKIIGAMMQHIVYDEYLPLLLDHETMKSKELYVPTKDYKYDPSISPNILNSFSTAAFRFGHSMVNRRVKKAFSKSTGRRLVTDFFNVNDFCNSTIDPVHNILLGLMQQEANLVDNVFTKELTHYLFANSENSPGHDLVAFDILRGRDHGLAPYNSWRRRCNLSSATSYDDMELFMKSNVINKIKTIYKDYRDVELFVGGISEKPVPGSIVGPTFGCIIAEQFRRLKFGDRFWYENTKTPGSFTQEQIREIRKTTVASLICRNTNVEVILPNAFLTYRRSETGI
ncbi:peroxidase-like protein 3 isoform X2 [Centruroides sculpturatus]|uniref:peroxidase-like protein 3 isoform X2 n=1 Tax=Centruroides sculpturatus TaxID=218467 RepID=UPI000C6D8CE0|nr:peroxidase-like protein 3 isoform X2 [Centruroides sculpturatus]